MNEYEKLIEAVAQYYGAGSDQWVSIATSAGYKGSEWVEIVEQVPNVDIIYNKAGDVVSYTVNDAWGTAVDGAGAIVNSNTQVSTLANASEIAVPADTVIDSAGNVAATSGMKTATTATATTVVKDVAIGVAAVAAGLQLGAAIDSALYNANPDFWDENGMSAINPQTWSTIVGENKTGQTIFNMVFGINPTTGNTQAYMDERALAYITQYLVAMGAFDGGASEWDDDKPAPFTSVHSPIFRSNEMFTPSDPIFPELNIPHYYAGITTNGSGTEQRMTGIYIGNSSNDDCQVTSGVYYDRLYAMITSKSPFTDNIVLRSFKPAGGTGSSATMTKYQYTYNGETVYYAIASLSDAVESFGTYGNNFYDTSAMYEMAWLLQYGNFTGGSGVEGITPQEDATLPTNITPDMTFDEVLAALLLLYPDIFANALTNSVVQPDGSVKTYTYVPVPFPENIEVDEILESVNPTGGATSTQADPTIDPTTTPQSTIDSLLAILTGTNPYNPVNTPPTDTTDFPDTGSGNTPAIVTPTGSASALYTVYNPSQSQLNSLGAWLWSSNFVDQLLKLFSDPMQAIIGLHKIFAPPPISGVDTIKVGYLDSGVSANLVSAQYTEIDCGSVSLKEYFGNALDYTDTDIYLYLPFVGIVPVSTLDVVRSNINVKYKVDVLTGACMAQVYVNRDNNAGGQLYCYAGDCAVKYPLSSGSYMGIVSSVLGIAGGVVGTIATGGAMLPLALGAGASALNSARTAIEHSGSLSGNAGAMGIKKPYFIIRRPQTKIVDNFRVFNGQSNNVYDVLNNCTGYTRVKYVNLENINATGDELTEIENILKTGVII